MKPEILETLLLDRALGELSPEVAALLDAHLAQHPDAAHRAAEFAATLQLARAATAAPAGSPPRPLDLARLRQVQHAQQSASRRAEIFRLAACLALGLGLGWWVHVPQSNPDIAAALPSAPPAFASPRATNPPARFWSLARLAAEHGAKTASAGRREDHFELHWNSAAKMPHVEEKL
jgi:anti-sigma factor RsiW